MDDEGQPDTPRLRALAAPTTVSPAAVVGMLGVVGEAERPPPSGATLAAGLRKRAARRAQLNRDDCKVAKGGVSGELSERVDPVDGICPHRDHSCSTHTYLTLDRIRCHERFVICAIWNRHTEMPGVHRGTVRLGAQAIRAGEVGNAHCACEATAKFCARSYVTGTTARNEVCSVHMNAV